MSAKRSALVTDGLWRKSLSAIRSLGKAGYDVSVMGDSWLTTGFWSRFASRRVLAPTAADDRDRFGMALLRALEGARGPGGAKPVLLPMEDASLEWVAANLPRVEPLAQVLLPPAAALEAALDKGRTIETARALGLPVPRTVTPLDASEFAREVSGLSPGEFVVKPRRGSGSAGVSYGKAPSAGWESLWECFGPMLVQERVPAGGDGLGVSLLMDSEGRTAASFAHKRLRQYPNSGGPSTDRVSIADPELVEMSEALLKRLGWRGIAMVEWKRDPRDGRAKLMEINPRFWGSVELAVRAGVDFPSLYARACAGEPLGPPPAYAEGVRCRWVMPGDLLRYWSAKRSEREGLREFFRGLPSLAEEWDPRDLSGSIATVLCTAGLALSPRYWRYVRRG